jgi:hypothetical protein
MIRGHIGNESTERISIEDMRARENLEWIGSVLLLRCARSYISTRLAAVFPLQTDTDRWERVLREYRIGRRLVFDLSIERHQTRLADVLAIASTLGHRYGSAEQVGMNLETGDSIITRTAGIRVITDDNMGTEW